MLLMCLHSCKVQEVHDEENQYQDNEFLEFKKDLEKEQQEDNQRYYDYE